MYAPSDLSLDPTGYRLPPHYYSAARDSRAGLLQYLPRRAWLEANGQPVEKLRLCCPVARSTGRRPGGLPSPDYVYQIRRGIPLEYQKICLEAAAGNDVQRLYWFIDGELYGHTKPGERLFYLPKPGRHRVICQDDRGRSTEVKLEISD